MPAALAGGDDGRRCLPPESAFVVCDRAPQRSGGVSDPPPKRGKCPACPRRVAHAPAPQVPVHVACRHSCLAVHERYAACIDATRLTANTRPSHAAGIRFARRAARRIDRVETVFGSMSLPSRSTGMRVGSIVECRTFSAGIPVSPCPGRHGIRPLCGGRDTRRHPGGVSSPSRLHPNHD